MSAIDKTVIFIPSLDPDEKLLKVVSDLRDTGFNEIVLLNDGSKSEDIFLKAQDLYKVTVLKHCVNMGKGRALKDGLNYIYNKYNGFNGVVTVDGDGQHSAKDTLRVAKALVEHQDSLIMGCRDFTSENIPARSRFGNVTTSRVMRFLCGIKLSDTQTGLRGIPMGIIPQIVTAGGERFEYELNMILECSERKIPLLEIAIDTIYLEENASSHFNPLVDSFKIYAVFLKFIISSLSSSAIDLVLFTIFCGICKRFLPYFDSYIIVCTVLARVCSALYNYGLNRAAVFKDENGVGRSSVRYAILAVVNCALSAGIVHFLYGLCGINETLIKCLTDTILFLASFYIQKEWVFKK